MTVGDFYTIQIVSERSITNSRNGGSRTYLSYELNIVFRDGERMNIMDHGNEEEVDRTAEIIANQLNIPIWKATF